MKTTLQHVLLTMSLLAWNQGHAMESKPYTASRKSHPIKIMSVDEPSIMLVKLELKHAEFLYQKLGPEVLAPLGFTPLSKEEWGAKIEKFIKEHDWEFVIMDKATNELIGMIGIENIDKEHPNHNMVAGWLTKNEWGKHKFTAALRLLESEFFATFPEQHLLQALTLPSNTRVLKMAKRLGFTEQKTTFNGQESIRLIYKKQS